MRVMLLGLAAPLAAGLAAMSIPASAQSSGVQNFTDGSGSHRAGGNGVDVFANGGSGRFQGCGFATDRRGRHDRRSRSGSCDISVGTWVNGGEWALYNNRTWESDSYNDWWHDRPDRAYPRWMSTNQDCQRQWWSGGGWRC